VQTDAGAPLASALITLFRSGDTTRVAGAITGADGTFRIVDVAPGGYLLEATHLGYRTERRGGFNISPGDDQLNLGVIRMEQSAIVLDDVVATAVRATAVILADRNVYSVRDMPAALGGRATDALRSVPELEVSVDGKVTSQGAAPIIQINGRRSPLQGEALDRYLQQLPAERIDRIEVISNPSARYEAEGQGGIVNIVMKRGESLGLSGNVAFSLGTRQQRGGSVAINYQQGRLTLFGAASGSLYSSGSENSDLRENLGAQPVTFIQQDSRDHASGALANMDLVAEVKVGPRGLLWSEVGVGRRTSETGMFSAYTHFDHLRHPTDRYDRSDDRHAVGLFGSSAVGYRNVSAARAGEWSIQLRRTFSDNDRATTVETYSLSDATLDLLPELMVAGENQDQSRLSVEGNLVRRRGSAQVEVGYHGSMRTAGSTFHLRRDAAENPEHIGESAGDFSNRDVIHAAFATADQRLGRFRIQLGVRGEQTDVRRTLPLLNSTYTTDHWDLFPSANISTSIGLGGQLRFSYSRRVDRPWGEDLLNPARPVLDPLNLRIGNPYLMPRYTQAMSLAASRTGGFGSLQLSSFYRRTGDSWEPIRSVDQQGVSTVTWENLATITSYGLGLNASVLQFGPLSGLVSVRGTRELRGKTLIDDSSRSSTRFSVVSNVNVRATSNLSLQGTATYIPAQDVPQGRISSMTFSTVGLRQQVGRGAINLSVVDPFSLQRFTFTTRDGTHVHVGSSTFRARRASLGISYDFGRPPQGSRRRGTSEGGEQESQAPSIR
jgi:ferric enterobactin receptor